MQQFVNLAGLAGESDAPLALDAFAVPPRFTGATFDSYLPDPRFPSQIAARERIAQAVESLTAAGSPGRGLLGRFRRSPAAGWSGLYLDGGFGVGKTHLLASAWHASRGVARAYLSFQELTYVVGALGMARTLDLFGPADLICLDEFELDDPGNTMLATSFVRGVLERDARVIATSNTLPNELGRGRFNADAFEREIGQLAAAFESVSIEGEDYRHRRFSRDGHLPRLLPSTARASTGHLVEIGWPVLLDGLATVHPIRYARIASGLTGLSIVDVAALYDQDTALRFVHFADKLYDQRVPLVIAGDVTLEDLFPSTFGYGPFERKFRRCRSRLFEMLSELLDTAALARGTAAADD